LLKPSKVNAVYSYKYGKGTKTRKKEGNKKKGRRNGK
jgi:hypothetical protein